jgi:hypothetical protein
VPTQSTGEQSRSNLRRGPINPPMPRQPGHTGGQPIAGRPTGNTGVQPIIARPSASTGAQPSIGRPAAGSTGTQAAVGRPGGNDPASVPTRFAAPVARPDEPANPDHESGRRRAPEPDGWADEDSFEQGGRHGSGSYEPVPLPAAAMSFAPPMPATRTYPDTSAYASADARSGGRRAEPEPAGAHTAGRSVTELLAAHRSAEEGPRRHRRRAD